MKKLTKLLLLLIAAIMAMGVLSACPGPDDEEEPEIPRAEPAEGIMRELNDEWTVPELPAPAAGASYTYQTYMSVEPSAWNPHTWTTSSESTILTYIGYDFYSFVYAERAGENGAEEGFKIVPELAADLAKDASRTYAGQYGIPEDVEELGGYAYQIELNPDAKWDNGDPITAQDYYDSMKLLLDPAYKNYRVTYFTSGSTTLVNAAKYARGEVTNFDEVGFLADTENNTITFILANPISEFDFYINISALFLVHKATYETGVDTVENLKATPYQNSVANTRSYGPYKLSSYEVGKQIVFEKNDKWYGWTDGKHTNQYWTTKIIVNIINTPEAALLSFLQGNLSSVGLQQTDLAKFGTSSALRKTPASTTWKISVNSDLEKLKAIDRNNAVTSTNTVLLANKDFRKALSLLIDRDAYVNNYTAGSAPAFYLLNSLYFYDLAKDFGSVYRNTNVAKQIIVDLYGIEFGADKTHKTLDDAYKAVNGYDLTQASALLQKVWDEDKNFDKGKNVHLRWYIPAVTLSANLTNQINYVQSQLQAAARGTSFEGKITFEGVADPGFYDNMETGVYELGFTAWQGGYTDSFMFIGVYIDEEVGGPLLEYGFNVEGDVDFEAVMGTTFKGKGPKVRSLLEWYRSINPGGDNYSGKTAAEMAVKVEILALCEKVVLDEAQAIPLYAVTSVSLISLQTEDITENYSIFYGYGGLRMMTYKYTDATWSAFVNNETNKGNLENAYKA